MSDYHWYFCPAKNEEPCIVCGKPTNRIDIHHEVRVCSIECAYVLDMEQAEQESDGDDE
jgi:predicted nucleic acid-binding Zn ribbon protein